VKLAMNPTLHFSFSGTHLAAWAMREGRTVPNQPFPAPYEPIC